MKNTKRCPKCGSKNIACVPDNAHRYLANSIAITNVAWVMMNEKTAFLNVVGLSSIINLQSICKAR